jgi:hypothetical protein
LDFVGTYTDYAINAVFFENYWNDGSIKEQERYFDNIVVSTKPIGCLDEVTGLNLDKKLGKKEDGNSGLKIYAGKQGWHVYINPDWVDDARKGFMIIYNHKGKQVEYISLRRLNRQGYAWIKAKEILSAGLYLAKIQMPARILLERALWLD